MGGGSGSSSTVVDKNLLPDYAQPQVESFLSRSNVLSLHGYKTYTGKTYADQNQDEIEGIAALANRGRNSHAILTKGETLLRDILDGLKLTNNPKITDAYLKRAEVVVQDFEENTLPAIHQRFNLSGNYGSDSHHIVQAKAAEQVMAKLSEIGLDVYFNDYVNERTHQSSALGYADMYGTQDVVNAELLRQAGLYAREYTQGSYEDLHKKWIDEQASSVKRLELLGNAIRALVGAHITEIKPYYRPSALSQMAGFALAGAGAIASIYMSTRPNTSPYSNANTYSGYTGNTSFVGDGYNLQTPSLSAGVGSSGGSK